MLVVVIYIPIMEIATGKPGRCCFYTLLRGYPSTRAERSVNVLSHNESPCLGLAIQYFVALNDL